MKENNFEFEKEDMEEFGDIELLSDEKHYEYMEKYNELVQKYMSESYSLVENAEENLRAVREACEEYAKLMKAKVECEVSIEHLSARVQMSLPFFLIGKRELELFQKISDKVLDISFIPIKSKLVLGIGVNYFTEDKSSPHMRATTELMEN